MSARLPFLLLALFLAVNAYGQRFGYIDSQVIIEKMPEYTEAQNELARLTEQWKNDVEKKYAELIKLRQELEAERVLLTPDLQKQRQEDIKRKEEELVDFQTKIFGVEGLLFQKRQDMMKPIQDKIFEAVQKVARQRRLSFIFDKSGDLSMIYSDPTHNYTDIVMEAMGIDTRGGANNTPANGGNNQPPKKN
jgi:outer membrane protein